MSAQLAVVWTLILQSESEGPTLISCAAKLLEGDLHIQNSFSRLSGARPQRILVADMATKDQVPSIGIDKRYILPGVQVASGAYNLTNRLLLPTPAANMERLGLQPQSMQAPGQGKFRNMA